MPITSLPTFILSDVERAGLADALGVFCYNPDDIAGSRARARDLWRRAASPALLTFLASTTDAAARRVVNLPTDGAAEGLSNPHIALAPKASRFSEAILLASVPAAASPYGISAEGDGVIGNLCPTYQARLDHSGLGSVKPLGLHVENAAVRRMSGAAPDGLALLGVSHDPAHATTIIADARSAYGALDTRDQAILAEPRFRLRLPERWRRPGATDSVVAPIVDGAEACPSFSFAFYGDMTDGLDPPAAGALARFHALVEASAVEIEIRPGTLLLVNNRLAAHGRSAFQPTFVDGRPLRWLQRLFWTNDLTPFTGWQQSADKVYVPPVC